MKPRCDTTGISFVTFHWNLPLPWGLIVASGTPVKFYPGTIEPRRIRARAEPARAGMVKGACIPLTIPAGDKYLCQNLKGVFE